MLADKRTGAVARAFDFFKSPGDFSLVPAADVAADILAPLERDSFRGGFALRIIDIAAPA